MRTRCCCCSNPQEAVKYPLLLLLLVSLCFLLPGTVYSSSESSKLRSASSGSGRHLARASTTACLALTALGRPLFLVFRLLLRLVIGSSSMLLILDYRPTLESLNMRGVLRLRTCEDNTSHSSHCNNSRHITKSTTCCYSIAFTLCNAAACVCFGYYACVACMETSFGGNCRIKAQGNRS